MRGVSQSQAELTKRRLFLKRFKPNGTIIECHSYYLGLKNRRSEFISMTNENIDLIICCLSENNLVAKQFLNATCCSLDVSWCEAWVEESGSMGHIRFYIPGLFACLKVIQFIRFVLRILFD